MSPNGEVSAARTQAWLDDLTWTHSSGPYQALDVSFGVRTGDGRLGDLLAATFTAFRVDSPGHDLSWFSVTELGCGRERRLAVYLGTRRLVVTTSPSAAMAHVLWALNQEVVAKTHGAVLIHAAAAERDGVVVVLPAAPDSGKTTLVTGLLLRGYRYITDEVFALDVVSHRLRPFFKALTLEAGAWPLFPHLAPESAASDPPGLEGAWHVPAWRLGVGPARPEATVRVLLGPRYRPGAATAFTSLRPAEGLHLLAENSFNPASWGQPGLSAAADMVRGCRVIGRLIVGDLSAACDFVDRAVNAASDAARREDADA